MVQVGQLSVEHPLVVVDSLISPVILGMDFLQQHDLVLDFASSPISVTTRHTPPNSHGQLQDIQPIVEEVQKAKAKICAVDGESSSELTEEVVDDCAIPRFSTTTGPTMTCFSVQQTPCHVYSMSIRSYSVPRPAVQQQLNISFLPQALLLTH